MRLAKQEFLIHKQIAVLMVVAIGLIFSASSLHAKKGFYLGPGLARQSISGDFDGQSAFLGTGGTGPVVLNGKMDSGNGLSGVIGYGINDHFSLEYFFAGTSHDATHQAIPGETMSASVAVGIIGPRLATGGEFMDLFLRAGYARGSVRFEDNASVAGSTTLEESEYSGAGFGFGLGVEFHLSKLLGLEIGYNKTSIDYDTLTAGEVNGTISDFSADISTMNVTVVFHF